MSESAFIKSSYSEAAGECVEVATNVAESVAVRDSKVPAGPVVRVGAGAWSAFLRKPPTPHARG